MKPVQFLGGLAAVLAGFPVDARHDAGLSTRQGATWFATRRLQADANDWQGCNEIRIRDDSGIYRVIDTASLADAVFVLHAFENKTQRTSQRDIEIAKA